MAVHCPETLVVSGYRPRMSGQSDGAHSFITEVEERVSEERMGALTVDFGYRALWKAS
ncbi:hypothetical protein J6590_049434 [Homalodisca vitripennis]|nr:hypothetical protein J6590_049434 [Homalodisca vitripennis]